MSPSEGSRAWYEAHARRYDRRNPGVPGDTEHYALLAEGVRVLEIGAGTGRVTAAMAETAIAVIALDHASAMLSIARSRLRGRANVSLVAGDARALPVGRPFGLIVLAYRTIHHLDPAARRQFWEDAVGLLEPGGRIAFDTWHGPMSAVGESGGVPFAPIAVPDLVRELGQAGLEIVRHDRGFGRVPSPEGYSHSWLVARGRSSVREKNFTKSLTQVGVESSMCTQSQTAHSNG
jgi:SAM-dependent methyltransferase